MGTKVHTGINLLLATHCEPPLVALGSQLYHKLAQLLRDIRSILTSHHPIPLAILYTSPPRACRSCTRWRLLTQRPSSLKVRYMYSSIWRSASDNSLPMRPIYLTIYQYTHPPLAFSMHTGHDQATLSVSALHNRNLPLRQRIHLIHQRLNHETHEGPRKARNPFVPFVFSCHS